MNRGKLACPVICAKLPELTFSAPGPLNRGVLVTLIDSARNCSLTRSLIETLLKIETSQLFWAGDRAPRVRETAPKVPPGAIVNALIFRYASSFSSGEPGMLGSVPLELGRCPAAPAAALSGLRDWITDI